MMRTTITNYISPDELCIAIRKNGGSAWVERQHGKDAILTDRSMAWVRRLARNLQWITP